MSTWLSFVITLLAALGAVAVVLALVRRRRPVGDIEAEQHLARETIARLQDLTARVAADVDEHATYVQEINAELSGGEQDSDVLTTVQRLIDANERMQKQLVSAEERLQAQARQIESHAVEARTDALTQVANRRAFDDELRRCLSERDHNKTVSTLMILDVDHFKKFNDTHGHQAGDEVLRGVARVLRNAFSSAELVARYGGEEFAIVFPGVSFAACQISAEKARQAVATANFRFQGKSLSVTASAGLSELLPTDNEQEWIRRADEALYASKKAGRNCGHMTNAERTVRLTINDPAAVAAQTAAAEMSVAKVGDEWLFEADTNELFTRDPIANVSSRPVFFDDLIRRLAQWRRGGAPLSLMMVQVDGLMRVATEHGPTAAATVLRVTSQIMQATMRDMDHVTRLGEDTFALLLPGAKIIDAHSVSERLRAAVQKCRLPRRAGAAWFTITVGAVEVSNGDDMRLILERARRALQAAIAQGRNCVIAHDSTGAPIVRMVPSNR
ncbi:diguanylate cyclase [Pirellula staleyi DSM 6068]|uniref:diguanylate cyclase n=1 Tax=Pirellula staleyi (strain ATCC 27377 / DSM 6068 / ICPB 4128) TaxID=530564 RepID=D2R798_PIRSD|nr:diguanylate cyclase [Pirellula staleyi]ADB15594.1 diguanylate cyclase [Pirellula staleyi DSM 6068]